MSKAASTRVVARCKLGDFLDQSVYPGLYAHLQTAFPEFGFEREGDKCVATVWPDGFMSEVVGKRPERINAYANAPWGIYVHGRGFVRWLTYATQAHRLRGREFVDTVNDLASRAHLALPEKALHATESLKAQDQHERRVLLDAAVEQFHEALLGRSGAAVRAYLEKRGVEEKAIREFRLGLATPLAVLRVMSEVGDVVGKDVADAVNLGILKDYIVIPWRAVDGQVLTLYGRWPGTPPGNKRKTMALPGSRTKSSPLFLDRAREAGHREVVAVEGLFDALIAQIHGDRRVVAYVAAVLSDDQVATLRRWRFEKVFLCGDPDSGGDTGTIRNVHALRKVGIHTYVVDRLPDNTDPDDFILANGIESWKERVRTSRYGAVHVADVITASATPKMPDADRQDIIDEVVRELGEFSGPDADEAYRLASDRLRVSVETLRGVKETAARRVGASLVQAFTGKGDPEALAKVFIDLGGHQNDAANAIAYLHFNKAEIRYVVPWGRFLIWDGQRYVLDSKVETQALSRTGIVADWWRAQASVTEKRMEDAPQDSAAIEELEELRKFQSSQAQRADSLAGRRAMVQTAATDAEIDVFDHEDLDADPWMLNTKSGVLELRTGRLLQHDPERLHTKLAPVDYSPGAGASRFRRFMEEILPDADVREFVQRSLGLALVGEQIEEIVLFLWGDGANGKSTLIKVIMDVLGDYAATTPLAFLEESRKEGHPTEIAALFRKRLTVCSEIEEDSAWKESKLKNLTGGDPRWGRRMYEDPWSYVPSDLIVVHGNHRPRVRGSDRGIWRRLLIVHFGQNFEGRAEKGLRSRLAIEEGPGILTWLHQGLQKYQRIGLSPPAAVLATTEAYRKEMDLLGKFLEDETEAGDPATTPVAATALYDRFRRWWTENIGDNPWSVRALGLQLGKKGLEKKRTKTGWIYEGLRLIDRPLVNDGEQSPSTFVAGAREPTCEPGREGADSEGHRETSGGTVHHRSPARPKAPPDQSEASACYGLIDEIAELTGQSSIEIWAQAREAADDGDLEAWLRARLAAAQAGVGIREEGTV